MVRAPVYWSASLALLALAHPAASVAQPRPAAAERLTLQTARDALVDRNLPVMAARHNIDLFRAQRVAAALKPDPTIVVTATQFTIPRVLTHPRYAGFATAEGAVLDTQYTIEVDRLIERGRKRELRMSQADVEIEIAEAQLANELRQQRFELTEAFLSALLAQANLGVLRQNLDDFGRIQQAFGAQVAEGYTAGVDLRRIGLELIDLQGVVNTAELDYAQSVRDVLTLVGHGEGAGTLEGDLGAAPVAMDLEQLRSLALAARPDLRAAELEVASARTVLELARAGRVRDVTIGAQYARSGPDNAVGVAIGVPWSTARRADTAIAYATALTRQAGARLGQARLQVLADVEKAWLAYRMTRDRLRLFDGQILRQAAEVRDIEQVAYREGERGLLSVLDAQRVYNQTLVSYNEARHAFATSVYQLERATGIDAGTLANPSTPPLSSGDHDD